jgi:hypothetical protein
MKVYVAASDASYEGYGAPEYVFLSRELADGFKAIHQDYEIFELDILTDLSTVPAKVSQPQREFTDAEKTSAAIFSRRIAKDFFGANVTAPASRTATSLAMEIRGKLETRRNVIEAEFNCFTVEHPVRCRLCSRLQPKGARMAWVDGSSGPYQNDSYEELRIGSKQSKSLTGSCFACIAASRAAEMI